MTTPLPPTGYATVADYELRTNTDVPAEAEDSLQQRLNDISALVDVYLGECAEAVALAYPDVLTALVCAHEYRARATPVGVRSESVGGTSVSYDTSTGTSDLVAEEVRLLDTLIERACGQASTGIGQVGVTYGGTDPYDHWAADIDLWVLTGGWRKR
jgi:hypothetical protein